MRHKLFEVIESAETTKRASAMYDYIMMAAILLSLLPLAFKSETSFFSAINLITTCLFVADYIARVAIADLKLNRGPMSFLIYPFTPMALVDLSSILPAVLSVAPGLKIIRIFRLGRAFRVFRAFRMLRYSRSIALIARVIRIQRTPLIAVGTMACAYILVSALLIFNVEPETFSTFFDAIYWAAISLTTVGYGDIYPVTTAGRVVTIFSSFVGIAIVALPSGIITAGYMDELQKENNSR